MQYGTYSPECFKDPENVIEIDTISSSSWEFDTQDLKFKLGEFDADIGVIRTIIEPAYPFFYAPSYVLEQF